MKLKINLRDEFVTVSALTGNIVFGISWEHDNVYYPSEIWTDFGVTILGWWTMNLLQIRNGADRGDFLFMDGPYSIQLQVQTQKSVIHCIAKGENYLWETTFDELHHEILASTQTVLYMLNQQKFTSSIKSVESTLLALKQL